MLPWTTPVWGGSRQSWWRRRHRARAWPSVEELGDGHRFGHPANHENPGAIAIFEGTQAHHQGVPAVPSRLGMLEVAALNRDAQTHRMGLGTVSTLGLLPKEPRLHIFFPRPKTGRIYVTSNRRQVSLTTSVFTQVAQQALLSCGFIRWPQSLPISAGWCPILLTRPKIDAYD
uniref:Putative trab domain-containing protein n=1 Tax=Ixodes ricinus TaxID=34613 RepID=A0A0K8R4V6_IXORI